MKDVYAKLQEDSKSIGEKNDCAVKAVSVVAGISYKQAHSLLEQEGRKFGKGTSNNHTSTVLKKLGFNLIPFKSPYKGLRSFKRNVWTNKAMLIWVSSGRHIVGVNDGKICDWTDNRCHRISRCCYVLKDNETEPLTPKEEAKETTRTRATRTLYALVDKRDNSVYGKFKRYPTKIAKCVLSNTLKIQGRPDTLGNLKLISL